eukprot:jgi/Mesen1/6320/ME000326S05460
MFSISAINDDDTRSQLEPLGPTKEAQEAKLMQKYQDALLHIHRKEHDVARTLLEAILHGTATASTPEQEAEGRQPHNSSSSMLQLRYLSLKNLGELLAKLDRCHASDAIRYYLQAAAMDDRDVVLWHRLGVLACRERHLAIARRAFEKGLQCSPRHCGCFTLPLMAHVCVCVCSSTLLAPPFFCSEWGPWACRNSKPVPVRERRIRV